MITTRCFECGHTVEGECGRCEICYGYRMTVGTSNQDGNMTYRAMHNWNYPLPKLWDYEIRYGVAM